MVVVVSDFIFSPRLLIASLGIQHQSTRLHYRDLWDFSVFCCSTTYTIDLFQHIVINKAICQSCSDRQHDVEGKVRVENWGRSIQHSAYIARQLLNTTPWRQSIQSGLLPSEPHSCKPRLRLYDHRYTTPQQQS